MRLGALAAGALVAGAVLAADGDAARQYRAARRLVEQGSPRAGEALRRVVDLDPRGALADDALVDQASLLPLARWPEELGRLGAGAASEALALLDRAAGELPGGDRIPEARLLRALVRLEPLPGHDPRAASRELAAIAALDVDVAPQARYAQAWLEARSGQAARAFDGLHRILLDWPASPAATRARVELARIELRKGGFGLASRWLEEAIERGAPEQLAPVPLRELAVRALLEHGTADALETLEVRAIPSGMRQVSALAALPGGGVVLASRREGRVVRLERSGRIADEWALVEPEAVAADEAGRPFVSAEASVWRLEPGGGRVRVAAAGDYAPLAALAVDALGGTWLLERRGRRIGRVEPGATEAGPFWEDRTVKLVHLAWDGSRLLALDGATGAVLDFSSGGPVPVAAPGPGRPAALAADPSGRIAVLDARAGLVTLVGAGGTGARFDCATADVRPAEAVGLGADGALHLVDREDGAWLVRP